MVDIASFVAQNFQPQGVNMLANAQNLIAMRDQNQLTQDRRSQENELRAAMQSGDVNALAKLDPGAAGQLFGLQSAQEQQSVTRLAQIADRIATSSNPKALFGLLQGSPEFEGISATLGMDFGQIGDLSQVDDDIIRQEARSMADSLLGRSSQAPSLTDDMKEYQFAQMQGYSGSFQEYMVEQKQAGASSTTIKNEGSIPPGYVVERDANGNPVKLTPIEGGPADMEAKNAADALRNKQEGAANQADIVTTDIDRALKLMDEGILPDTGFGSILAKIPGTDAKAIGSLLDTVKANIGFEQLQKMRESSPTGGALGNVTEKEIMFLQALAGNLDQGQRKEDLAYNLNRVWNGYQDVIHGPNAGPPRRELNEQSAAELPGGWTVTVE